MASDDLPGYTPSTPTSFARPVQVRDATGGLSGVETPDGHGVLMWANSGEIFCAVVDTPMDFIVDDIVPLIDIRTVASPGGTIYGTSVFMANSDLLCVSHEHVSNRCHVRVRKANNPNDPTIWTVLSDIWDRNSGGPFFGDPSGCGVPLIMDSGRWVYGGKGCEGFSDAFQAVNAIVYTSDDSGASWQQRLIYAHPNFFPRTEFTSDHIAIDPVTGFLWWMSGTTISFVSHQIAIWHSADDGTTWTISSAGTTVYTQPHIQPAINSGTNIYAIPNDGGIYVYDGSGYDVTDWIYTGENWAAPGVHKDPDVPGKPQTTKMVITSFGVFFFVFDQVMFTPSGPIPPSFIIPILHIPFKDRLKNVRHAIT